MQARAGFRFKGKRFSFSAKKCNEFEKILGLMFSRRENAENLLFEFKKPARFSIHSFFVFFPFVAVWLDEKGKVMQIRKVRPFTFAVRPRKAYQKLLEIPINRKNLKKIRFLVDS